MQWQKVQERKGILLHDVPCDHKRYCELGRQQVAFKETIKKSKGKQLDRSSQQAVVEALQFADNVVGRPSTKQKTRMDAIQTIPNDEKEANEGLTETEGAKKGKRHEFAQLSEKEQKILQVAEVCGVDLPYADRSKNFTSGTFETSGTSWCREQYVTTKHCSMV